MKELKNKMNFDSDFATINFYIFSFYHSFILKRMLESPYERKRKSCSSAYL